MLSGANRGIGAAIAGRLADDGYRVADLVATMIALPNTASVSELLIGCRMEAWA